MKNILSLLTIVILSSIFCINTSYITEVPGKGVIYINYSGFNPADMVWGKYEKFSPSCVSDKEQIEVNKRVQKHFSNYDVLITSDESLFYKYPVNLRIRVTVTDNLLYSYNFFGFPNPLYGCAFYNQLYLGDTTSVLISTKDIESNNTRFIADVITHEVGHSLGLCHQAVWKKAKMIMEYNMGDSCSAPIMGFTKETKDSYWDIGINQIGQYQNDTAIIAKTFRRLKK